MADLKTIHRRWSRRNVNALASLYIKKQQSPRRKILCRKAIAWTLAADAYLNLARSYTPERDRQMDALRRCAPEGKEFPATSITRELQAESPG